MPDPIKQQIRSAVVDLLIDRTSAGKNVTADRLSGRDVDALPAIQVVTGDQSFEPFSMGTPPILQAELELEIHCLAKGIKVDDQLDVLLSEVVKAVMQNHPEWLNDVLPVRSELAVHTGGEVVTGSQAIYFVVQYCVRADDHTQIA